MKNSRFFIVFYFLYNCYQPNFNNLCDPKSETYFKAYSIRLALGINSPPCGSGAGLVKKEITSYSIPSLGINGVISGNQISLSSDTLTTLTAQIAKFTTTGTSVSISGIEQISEVTSNSFDSNLIYKVTAKDGSTQDYTVTLTAPRSYGGGSLRIWLKADSLSLNDDDQVAIWNDLSGYGNSLPQSTASARPIYKSNQINNLPSIQFRQATSQKLQLTSTGSGLYVTNSGTLFIIIKLLQSYPAGTSIFNIHGSNGREMAIVHPSGQFYQCRNDVGCNPISGLPLPQNQYLAHGSVQVLTSSNSEYWNGDLKGTVTAGLYDYSGAASPGDAFLSNGFLDADIAEVLYFNTALSQNEIDKIFCYLRSKYNLISANASCGV